MSIDLKKAQPFAVGSLLVIAIGLGGNAMWAANSVENMALANEKDIFYEKEMRIVGAAFLEQKLEDLDEDLNEFQKEVKQETGEIKDLLNELLLRQAAPVQ